MKNKLQKMIQIALLLFFVSMLTTSCKKDDTTTTIPIVIPPANNQLVYGSLTDIDGNVYKTIKIGNQTWMAENLKVTHYRNNDPIPNIPSEWITTSAGAYCPYNFATSNSNVYGMLYNWYAVKDIRNLAPTGWHVSTQEDWKILTDSLGGISIAASKLKEKGILHYNSGNTDATNATGFTALPGGYIDKNGIFHLIKFLGQWWTPFQNGSNSTNYWGVGYLDAYLINNTGVREASFGLSVRCVKD